MALWELEYRFVDMHIVSARSAWRSILDSGRLLPVFAFALRCLVVLAYALVGYAEPTSEGELAVLRVRAIALENGQPIAGAFVSVSSLDPGVSRSVVFREASEGKIDECLRSDGEGNVLFRVPVNRDLEVTAAEDADSIPSVAKLVSGLQNAEVRTLTLRVPVLPDIVMYGKIVDSRTLLPLAYSSVEVVTAITAPDDPLHSSKGSGGGAIKSSRIIADGDGRFRLTAYSWRRQYVVAACGNYTSFVFAPPLGHGTKQEERLIALHPCATANVRLIDSRAHYGASTVLTATQKISVAVGIDSIPAKTWTAQRSDDGRFSFQELSARTALMLSVATDPDAQPTQLGVFVFCDGGASVLEVPVDGCDIEGRIVDDSGRSVSGQVIQLKRMDSIERGHAFGFQGELRSGSTDAAGAFKFKSVPVGEWVLLSSLTGGGQAAQARKTIAVLAESISISAGMQALRVNATMCNDLSLSGIAVDDEGGPARGVRIAAFHSNGVHIANAVTDESGHFALAPVARADYRLFLPSQSAYCLDGPLLVNPRESNIRVHLSPAGSIEGTLIDRTGIAIRSVVVTVRPADYSGDQQEIAWTGPAVHGTFTVAGLAPGLYDLVVEADHGRIGFMSGCIVRANETNRDIVVHVEAGAVLNLYRPDCCAATTASVTSQGVSILRDVVGAGSVRSYVVPEGVVDIAWKMLDGSVCEVTAQIERWMTHEVVLGCY